jgi:simple sugar transport system substrate-binding protein
MRRIMKLNTNPGRRALASAALVALMAASVGACSSSDPSGAAGAKSDNLKITVVSGPLSDPFFGAIKAGTAQAAKDFGVKVDYTAAKDLSNLAPDYARLGDAAFAGHPDGVVMSYFLPDAQGPAVKKMIAAGIPVTFMNQGLDWETLGGLNYVGEDPTVVGEHIGQRFTDSGKKDVICFNHAAGIQVLQMRCDGLKKVVEAAGGKFTQINVPSAQGSNPTVLTSALSGALRKDPNIDAIFTLGSSAAELAAKVIDEQKSSVTLATCDLSTSVLNLIKDGKIAYAADQQPYLQGYYAVQTLVQHLRLGVHPIGQIGTSPNWVTKDNVAELLKINKEHSGVRGAS